MSGISQSFFWSYVPMRVSQVTRHELSTVKKQPTKKQNQKQPPTRPTGIPPARIPVVRQLRAKCLGEKQVKSTKLRQRLPCQLCRPPAGNGGKRVSPSKKSPLAPTNAVQKMLANRDTSVPEAAPPRIVRTVPLEARSKHDPERERVPRRQ